MAVRWRINFYTRQPYLLLTSRKSGNNDLTTLLHVPCVFPFLTARHLRKFASALCDKSRSVRTLHANARTFFQLHNAKCAFFRLETIVQHVHLNETRAWPLPSLTAAGNTRCFHDALTVPSSLWNILRPSPTALTISWKPSVRLAAAALPPPRTPFTYTTNLPPREDTCNH